jgi:restriction endonuclease Mrr
VELTAQTRDGGVDMIAVHKEVFGIATRYVIECKRWSRGRKVTIDLVRALYGAKEAHKADQAIYVTSATFTKHAWNISKTGQLRNVTLIDFEGLREWFETYLKSEAASRPSTSQDRRVLLT